MAYKVLYIEDSHENRFLVQKALEYQGYLFAWAHGGIQGLEMIQKFSPDILLLDINLPDMDAYEIARTLKSSAEPRLREIPIIAITANAYEDDAEFVLEAGCDVYMSEPINIQELRSRVEAFIS